MNNDSRTSTALKAHIVSLDTDSKASSLTCVGWLSGGNVDIEILIMRFFPSRILWLWQLCYVKFLRMYAGMGFYACARISRGWYVVKGNRSLGISSQSRRFYTGEVRMQRVPLTHGLSSESSGTLVRPGPVSHGQGRSGGFPPSSQILALLNSSYR